MEYYKLGDSEKVLKQRRSKQEFMDEMGRRENVVEEEASTFAPKHFKNGRRLNRNMAAITGVLFALKVTQKASKSLTSFLGSRLML